MTDKPTGALPPEADPDLGSPNRRERRLLWLILLVPLVLLVVGIVTVGRTPRAGLTQACDFVKERFPSRCQIRF